MARDVLLSASKIFKTCSNISTEIQVEFKTELLHIWRDIIKHMESHDQVSALLHTLTIIRETPEFYILCCKVLPSIPGYRLLYDDGGSLGVDLLRLTVRGMGEAVEKSERIWEVIKSR